jgi:hypothetical protein
MLRESEMLKQKTGACKKLILAAPAYKKYSSDLTTFSFQ